ncbi:hypothetical protein FIBSPDRAFT_1039751 [Athelia psychrophila]|uniref:MYND-type domain-containing protein n=1 Tax=Athelia psychrophila TaxID=1759441 RepID=A0A166R9E8_9AGAM|nr:hypothetical protein FIBSPDRAFT_1039751 [Fibularhizoctonia sp. CBS 109695]
MNANLVPPSDADLRKLDIFFSDDFAVVLGVKKSVMDDGRNDWDEATRLDMLGNVYLRRNAMEADEQQEIVWSRFCALYLPAAINRFIDPPKIPTEDPKEIAKFRLFSPCSEMLVQTQHNAYFAKYLRSKSPLAANGKRLPRIVAERIAELGTAWEPELRRPTSRDLAEHYEGILASAVQLLCTLQTAYIKELDQESVVPGELRRKLQPLLQGWSNRYRGTILGDASVRVLLNWSPESGDSWFRDYAKTVRKHTLGWDVCGLSSCEVTTGLKACSKCHTVRYCSTPHQVMHWKMPSGARHSQLCHKTEY